MMAVQLLPDGLVLTEPATFTIALPEALEGGFMAIHISGDSIEFLDGDIHHDDGMFTFSAPIEHFSVVSIVRLFFETSMKLDPVTVLVDQTQGAAVTIKATADPVSVLLNFYSDPPGEVRLFRFSAPQPPFTFEDSEINWDGREPPIFWDPGKPDVEITETAAGWETSPVSSRCLESGSYIPYLSSRVSFQVTLLSKGEPEAEGFFRFSQAISPGPVERLVTISETSLELLDKSPGDTFQVSGNLFPLAVSKCTEKGDSSTATETPETEVAIAIGTDPKGDGKNGESKPVTQEEDVPGADIKNVRYELGPSGEHCFFIEVYGDGKKTATDPEQHLGDYLIDIEIPGSDGWGTRVQFS